MALGGLWGGAYGMHAMPEWAGFPCFMTAFLLVVCGLIAAAAPFAPKD